MTAPSVIDTAPPSSSSQSKILFSRNQHNNHQDQEVEEERCNSNWGDHLLTNDNDNDNDIETTKKNCDKEKEDTHLENDNDTDDLLFPFLTAEKAFQTHSKQPSQVHPVSTQNNSNNNNLVLLLHQQQKGEEEVATTTSFDWHQQKHGYITTAEPVPNEQESNFSATYLTTNNANFCTPSEKASENNFSTDFCNYNKNTNPQRSSSSSNNHNSYSNNTTSSGNSLGSNNTTPTTPITARQPSFYAQYLDALISKAQQFDDNSLQFQDQQKQQPQEPVATTSIMGKQQQHHHHNNSTCYSNDRYRSNGSQLMSQQVQQSSPQLRPFFPQPYYGGFQPQQPQPGYSMQCYINPPLDEINPTKRSKHATVLSAENPDPNASSCHNVVNTTAKLSDYKQHQRKGNSISVSSSHTPGFSYIDSAQGMPLHSQNYNSRLCYPSSSSTNNMMVYDGSGQYSTLYPQQPLMPPFRVISEQERQQHARSLQPQDSFLLSTLTSPPPPPPPPPHTSYCLPSTGLGFHQPHNCNTLSPPPQQQPPSQHSFNVSSKHPITTTTKKTKKSRKAKKRRSKKKHDDDDAFSGSDLPVDSEKEVYLSQNGIPFVIPDEKTDFRFTQKCQQEDGTNTNLPENKIKARRIARKSYWKRRQQRLERSRCLKQSCGILDRQHEKLSMEFEQLQNNRDQLLQYVRQNLFHLSSRFQRPIEVNPSTYFSS
eukprot:m.9992 g.9992  ORF g.9992 m.9992 type:complete len:708 (+) comp6479_c0_seq2:409-2532(+)